MCPARHRYSTATRQMRHRRRDQSVSYRGPSERRCLVADSPMAKPVSNHTDQARLIDRRQRLREITGGVGHTPILSAPCRADRLRRRCASRSRPIVNNPRAFVDKCRGPLASPASSLDFEIAYPAFVSRGFRAPGTRTTLPDSGAARDANETGSSAFGRKPGVRRRRAWRRGLAHRRGPDRSTGTAPPARDRRVGARRLGHHSGGVGGDLAADPST